MPTSNSDAKTLPPQQQERQPGVEHRMHPRPASEARGYRASGRLRGKVALVTGGDSGIGRAVAIMFAKEGAEVAIAYLDEDKDARETEALVRHENVRSSAYKGDVGDPGFCRTLVQRVVEDFGHLDVLINNAGEQHPKDFAEITPEQMERTFRTNIFSMFYLTQAALPHLTDGSSIVNTTSITAYRGNPKLIDYSSTKGAIVSFTRSLSVALADKGIRVNAVAPGPIWTPLIPSTFPPEAVAKFGSSTPMKRPGQPDEVATCFVFLASSDASYITGQVLHPNGGQPVES